MIGAVVFDAYGTLFDVSAAARRLEGSCGTSAETLRQISRDWRMKQLQYSWIRAITGQHADFWDVTQAALDWALEAAGSRDAELRARLLELYRALDAYEEVPDMLARLSGRKISVAILYNGSPGMLTAAVESAGLGNRFDAILSVESVGVFKPASTVYDLVGREFGTEPSQVLFISTNGWDVAAAAGYGFDTVWINRAHEPVDRLPCRPRRIVQDLRRIPDLLGTEP